MNIDKALKTMTYKFSNYKTIWVNNTDKLAVKEIEKYITKCRSESFKDNVYFYKLYAFVLGHYLEKYNTSINSPIPHKQLHCLLNRPFENIIDDITSKLNFKHQYDLLEEAGCNLTIHPCAISSIERDKNINNLKKLIPLGNNKKILFENAWTTQEIEDGITKQINNFLNESR